MQSTQIVNLPEPTWINTPVFFNMIWESLFPIPLSHFGQVLPLLPWLDITSGTLHFVLDPLVHPKPSFARCKGHIVIELIFAGWANMAARLRTRSTSSFGPEKPKLAVWFAICFEQASRGIISVSFFLSLLSKPQIPPTIDLNEQHTSIFAQQHEPYFPVFTFYVCYWYKDVNFRFNDCPLKFNLISFICLYL